MTQIVVGVDGSGPSRAALGWALARAHDVGAPVLLAHVVDDEWGLAGPDVSALDADQGRLMLDEALSVARDFMPSLELSSRLVHGSPAWELVGLATKDDLLVVGTHKTGYLNGRVLGTRSVVVASVAPCSVVVVPDATAHGRQGILVGVAAGGSSDAAVVAGALEARRLRQDLTLLHAVPAGADDGAAGLAAAAALAMATVPGLAVRSRLSRRRPAEALLDASRTAVMLVLGPSRREPVNAGFLGSVTHEVLLNITTTVMVARE